MTTKETLALVSLLEQLNARSYMVSHLYGGSVADEQGRQVQSAVKALKQDLLPEGWEAA